MPMVTVIIPVFNTERYLDECLDSVQGQTLKDIEIICVDDCSSDGSPSILDRRAADDKRLKVIHLEKNVGLSDARNRGLDLAAGSYVYFLDSDDWIDSGYLEAMLCQAEEHNLQEVINLNYRHEFEVRSPQVGKSKGNAFKTGYYNPVDIQTRFNPAVWTRLFRRDFLERHGIRFSGARYAEDLAFSGVADILQDKCFAFEGPCHHYRQREGSLMRDEGFSFYNALGYRDLYINLTSRGLPLEGVRLFSTLGPVVLDSEEKFDELREYSLKIADIVSKDGVLYRPHDRFLVGALVSCEDYSTFVSAYGTNSLIAFYKAKVARGK
jgi:glycosyltransferase involved in cell wall biosynthesis